MTSIAPEDLQSTEGLPVLQLSEGPHPTFEQQIKSEES